jgi:hypothetical protein
VKEIADNTINQNKNYCYISILHSKTGVWERGKPLLTFRLKFYISNSSIFKTNEKETDEFLSAAFNDQCGKIRP